ncbi:MAG: hypothetical protein L0K86_01490 [Actinomycetia bacterium]|nr:hypothetical protein [Actinomycetes bacterium]
MAMSSAYGSIFIAKDEWSSMVVMATVPVGTPPDGTDLNLMVAMLGEHRAAAKLTADRADLLAADPHIRGVPRMTQRERAVNVAVERNS